MNLLVFQSSLFFIYLAILTGCTSGGGGSAAGIPSLDPTPTVSPNPTTTPTPSFTPTVPTLDYSSSAGTTGVVGNLMSISPSSFSSNGANITACEIKSGTTALPFTFTVAPTTCVISGTPTGVLSPTQYTLVATNAVGISTDAVVTLSVNATVPSLSYASSNGTSTTVGTALSIIPSLLAANGANVIACGIANGTTALPNTLSVNPTSCQISGTPTSVLPNTVYQLVATNSQGNSEAAVVTITVNATVGGSLSGLSGTLVIQNNGGDNLTLSTNGTFIFPTALGSGSSYSVSILNQPIGQFCSVTNGSGSITSSSISSVSISCVIPTWASTIQNGASGGVTIGKSVAVDSSGNTYVTGSTTRALDGQTQHGSTDYFITKYNPLGSRQWTIQNGASLNAYARGVATDSSGNVYVTGYVSGSLDNQTASGGYDLFITKYNSNGVRQWTVQDGSNGNNYSFSIAVDSGNNIYVTGTTALVAIDGQVQHGTSDLFISKYNSNGIRQWTIQDGATNGSVQGNGIATDSSGNVYVTGYTNVGIDGQTQHGANDFFVTKYDTNGTLLWTAQNGASSGTTYGFSIAIDNLGNVYATGETNVSLDSQSIHGSFDLFLIKYSSSGLRLWTILDGASPGIGVTQGFGVAVDSSANPYIAGSTSVAIDGQIQHGSTDFFISKYNSNGVRQWTNQDGATSGTSSGNSIATDAFGNILVTGDTNVAIDGQFKHGNDDLFITQYSSAGVHH